MTQISQKSYGQWSSPITGKTLSQGMSFSDLMWNSTGALVWRERFQGKGRLIVQPGSGQASRILNTALSAGGGVGYGGGSFAVDEEHVFFVEEDSKRIYKQKLSSGLAQPLTPEYGAISSPRVSPDGQSLLYIHHYENDDCLALVDTDGDNWPRKLVFGDDFYMHPRWHPEMSHVAWISWNHPHMPWDGTTLSLAELDLTNPDKPCLGKVQTIAGDENTATFQPEFSPRGRYLAYVSDQSGWWQLYIYDLESHEHRQLTDTPAEHGKPAWQQEMRTFAFSADGACVYIIRNQNGMGSIQQIEISSAECTRLDINPQYTWFEQIAVSPVDSQLACIASGGSTPPRILSFQPGKQATVLRRATSEEIPRNVYSTPQHITWQGMDGEDVHGLYYPPRSTDQSLPGQPPLIVLIHGGPTSQRVASFQPEVQYFTSRGYAVLQPNYRGSTGYGRAYRNALRSKWGVYDVRDAVSGARHLAAEKKVNEEKLVIMGSSAGGYTALKTLVDYPGVFRAGISLYGIANQFTLVADTHKFEQHYSDSLLGPLPQKAELYRERSPLFKAHKIQDAVAIFQGGEDKVVSQDQAEAIVQALKENGVPHEYHLYPEEGHGFRKPETIQDFYQKVEQFLDRYVLYT